MRLDLDVKAAVADVMKTVSIRVRVKKEQESEEEKDEQSDVNDEGKRAKRLMQKGAGFEYLGKLE